ncbi:phosphopantetheine-binding protein [Amycolatopsis samaneae]|uniref:Phosphopantetheine-binding protein n=1 Tax=Amycolatopsis samaneae TaxID=664691 RepID=A0ABW5GCW4_9PSEU
MWDDRFENILRKYLPFLSDDETLAKETSLRDLGLDSLGTVELLSSLEGTYGVRFVDEALTMETFATAGVLWDTLAELRGAAA